jgi:hypothetical protein
MIADIINKLKESDSTKHKESVLQANADNETLKEVLNLTYNPRIDFYVKNVTFEDAPSYKRNDTVTVASLESTLDSLKKIYNREITGNEARDFVAEAIYRCVERDVVQLIINRNLRAGISTKTINKVFGKDFIPETPYMGAVSYSEKHVAKMFANGKKAYSDKKYDGKYSNAIVQDGAVEFVARSGEKQFFSSGKFIQDILALLSEPQAHVLNGELLVEGFDRLTANGILNSISSINEKRFEGEDVSNEEAKFIKKHGITMQEAQERINYVVWDIVPIVDYLKGFWGTPRHLRVEFLEELNFTDKVMLAEYKIVNNFEEAKAHLIEKLQLGEEGTILKAYDAPWKDGKDPNLQIKLKVEFNIDLRIVGFLAGDKNSKYKDTLGTILLETEDGILETGCGSGLDEKSGIRDEIWNNKDKYLNGICQIKCNGLSKNRNGGNSVLFPVFEEIRFDKTKANTFQECVEVQDMALGLKKEIDNE